MNSTCSDFGSNSLTILPASPFGPEATPTKTFSREVAEPCLSGCDSGCVSWIKFVACIARVIQHDLHVHLLLRLWMDSAKATRVVSSCSRLHPNRWLDGPGWRLSGSGRIDAWQIVCRRAKE